MKKLNFLLIITLVTFGLLFIPFSVLASGPPKTSPPGESNDFLSGPAAGDPLDIALDYLHQNRESLGLTEEDLADVVVKDRYTSQHNQVTHIYLRQRLAGIEVFNGDININIDREGRVINLGNRFVPNLNEVANSKLPSLTAITAVNQAAQHLNLTLTQPLVVHRNIGGASQEVTLSNGGISQDDIPVKLMYQPVEKSGTRLAWNLVLRLENDQDWWNMTVDAETGEILHQNNWIANDTYRIYPLPLENPGDGAQTQMINPADPIASPYGWHDTNGITGTAEYTDTRGNNVFAQEDTDRNNTGGFRPDGGPTLTFDFPITLTQSPSTYQSAAITNLFYWNNVLHDIHYRYGFDEAAGNFQENTYSRGGTGGDPVQADAQDGSGTNNANFATPADGSDPRMQMFLFTYTTPNRDGDLDNGIIIHEYGHGVSNRLTGGPSNVSCLRGAQSGGAGEGWSDWWSLVLTAKITDTRGGAYPVGTYVLGQSPNGRGIRSYPYSTNMITNPLTYGDLPGTGGEVHDVGEIWTVTLWDMYWNLVDDHGFDPNLYSGHGGNNLAMQLVMDGLKLQPCSPTFLDARDAILQADMVNNSGANQCRIWEAFAKRGMGVNANDGGNDDSLSVTENFELPLQCRSELVITKRANPSPAIVGKVLTYTLTVSNYTSRALTGVVITDTVPMSTTYVSGSASNGGSESGGVIRWNIGQMAPDTAVTRTFQVVVNTPPPPTFFDDMESGSGKWAVSHGRGTEDWVLNRVNPHSGSNSWFASDPVSVTDKYLVTANPILIPANSVLSFWHYYNTEGSYDGGVVEISTNGGAAWTDLDEVMIQNGYNGSISTSYSSPIAGRRAFTGDSGRYLETVVDLNSYTGMNARIRFRMASDSSISRTGWYVDDVSIQRGGINNTAYVSAAEGYHDSDTIITMITLAPEIAVNPAALASTQPANVTTTKLLTISNAGTANLTWTIYELGTAPRQTPPPVHSAPAADSNPARLGPATRNSGEMSPTPAGLIADTIQDGGFEAGPFGGFWSEHSNLFNTPICDVSTCGRGNGSGPHSGDHWAWFGGYRGFEQSYLTQTVTITRGVAALIFWLEIPQGSGTGRDVLQVVLDNTVLFSVTDNYTRTYPAYIPVSLNVSRFADNNNHTLMFTSTIRGGGTSITNFFVDDVALMVNDHIPNPTWVSVSPITGTTPVRGSTLVTVTFNSTELNAGSYRSNLYINSNDPANPEVVVPLVLDITEAKLSITQTVAAEHTPVQPGDALTYTIVVANNGELDATNVVVTDTLPAYVVGANLNTTVTITAGQSITFTLLATLALDTPAGAVITNTASYSHTSSSGQASTVFTVLPGNTLYLPIVIQDNTQ